MVWLRALLALVSIGLVRALAVKRQAIASLTTPQIKAFAPFTHFAGAAYCDPSKITHWNCGAHCKANPDFQTVATGGDGSDTQFWFVGFSPSLKTVIVAHQGTNPPKIIPLVTDADFFLKPLNSSLFPGISSSIKAHDGFVDEHASTATAIFSAVKSTLSAEGASSVTVVGHSLGAALALLDGLSFRLQLDPSVRVRVVGYGMPRVGNQAFADLVDERLSGLVTHVNNKKDPVPILPGISMGFHHVSGEIHIQDSGAWDNCTGQDNPSKLCTVGDVKNIARGKLKYHNGPYAGITMGCSMPPVLNSTTAVYVSG